MQVWLEYRAQKRQILQGYFKDVDLENEVTMKIRSRLPHINSWFCHNDTMHNIELESIVQFKRYTKPYFGQNLTFQSAGVTLKWGQGHQNLINS